MNLYHFFPLVLLAFIFLQGCNEGKKNTKVLSQRERQLCMERTSDVSVNAERARENLKICLQDVRAGKLDLDQNDIPLATKPMGSSLTPIAQYQYCRLNSDQIKRAYNLYVGANTRLALFERSFGSSDERTQQMRARVNEAEAILQRLLPVEIIGDTPLVPDAANKFSNCSLPDFQPASNQRLSIQE